MILSGTITLDPATHAASTATVRLRLARLDERRRSAGLAVDRALATWRGDAAEVFRARWEAWDRGAVAVVEQLSCAAQQLDLVRADLAAADDGSAEVAGRIVGRLG